MKLHWTRRIAYTPGVEEIAEQHGAYWLLDAIASYQPYQHVAAEHFQVWKLAMTPTKSAVLTMTDGNTDKAIVRQEIEFTDFPQPGTELWCVMGELFVLMLPDEY